MKMIEESTEERGKYSSFRKVKQADCVPRMCAKNVHAFLGNPRFNSSRATKKADSLTSAWQTNLSVIGDTCSLFYQLLIRGDDCLRNDISLDSTTPTACPPSVLWAMSL